MLTVTILIDGKTIFTRTATNVGRPVDPHGNERYVLDDGTVILHKATDGAAKLARMILDTIPNGR